MDVNKNACFDTFYERLLVLRGISPLWKKVLDTLRLLQPDICEEALIVLGVYFSLLDDGNTCISLDAVQLLKKWQKKLDGLLLSEGGADTQEAHADDYDLYETMIRKGLPQINEKTLPNLIEEALEDDKQKNPRFDKPFVISRGWLFAAKYYKAKISIEARIKMLMKADSGKSAAGSQAEKNQLKDYFLNATGLNLKDEQLSVICRGLTENLIITGGPGTGKTTVVCYLLWELLKNADFSRHSLYLAAPSGKAADRLKESISGTLERICMEERRKFPEIFERLNSAHSSTIHRLLSYRPSENGFLYNAKNQFPQESIFVIDEASMIDINLFSSLLEAVPEGARLFILGDKDQLPSVQAGAVLGELLAKKKDSVVALKESTRFNDDSEVGRLKDALQSDEELDEGLAHFTAWDDWKKLRNGDSLFSGVSEDKYPVISFELAQSAEGARHAREIALAWSEAFYDRLAAPESPAHAADEAAEKLDELWKNAQYARILCAEHHGSRGAEEINREISSHLMKKISLEREDYYPGQLLMLTKNQTMFELYNGDSGIVVRMKADEKGATKYLMVKKDAKASKESAEAKRKGGIFRIGSYIFYPLHLLPRDSLETAYAITIHKSQGSGYKSILIFLPSQEGHPLLNRQIAYTAITRTEGSTFIAASRNSLELARRSRNSRDTMIQL